jgi:hypothetical protein
MKKFLLALLMCFMLIGITNSATLTVSAAPSAKTEKAVTGTQELAIWGTAIIIAISAATTGFFVAKEFLKIQAADDETDTKPYFKRIKTIVIAGICAILSSGIVGTIVGFYA